MSRKIYFDYGSGWEDVTPNVLDSVRITERKCSDDYHYAQNMCNMSVIMGDGPEIPDSSNTYYYKGSWTDDDGWSLTLGESDLPTTRGGVYKRDFITISGTMDYVVKIKATSTGASQIVLVGEKADNTYETIGVSLLPGGNAITTFAFTATDTYTGLGFIWDARVNVEWEWIYVGDGMWVSILDKLRAASEVNVKILSDDASTQYFQGIITNKPSHIYDGKFANTVIEIEATDSLKKFDVPPIDFVIRNAKIMDSSNKNQSIVHQLAYTAGLTDDYIGNYDIDITISGFATTSGVGSILSMMDTLLHEYGYVCRMNEYDTLYPQQWIVASGSGVDYTFNEDNIAIELSVSEDVKEYDGVEVTYYNLGEKTNVRLYRDDLPLNNDGSFLGYIVPSGLYYPIEANVINEDTGLYQEVFFDYDDTTIKALTNKAIVQGLDFDPKTATKVFKSDFSSIVCTSGHTLETLSDGLTLISGSTIFGNNRARVLYKNNTASGLNIYYLNIYGDVLYKSAERTVSVVTVSGSKNIEQYQSDYIYDKTTAQTYAKARAKMLESGLITYEFASEDDVAIGSYVQITANNRTNQTAHIIQKVWDSTVDRYQYTCKAYDTNYGVVSGGIGSKGVVPKTYDVVSVGLSTYAKNIQSDINGENLVLNDPDIVAKVLLNGNDDTANWTIAFTAASGLLGSVSGATYTISGLTTDNSYLTAEFSKTNYANKTLRCDVAKLRQGVVEYVIETIPEQAPIYKGRIAYGSLSGTTGNQNDRILAYSTTSGECGIYKMLSGTWTKQYPPSTEYVSEAWPDIIYCANNSFPSTGTAQEKIQAYTGPGLTYFEMLGANLAFINSLFAQTITLTSGGSLQSANYAESGGYATAGVKIDAATGIVNSHGAKFRNADIAGTLTSSTINGTTISGGTIQATTISGSTISGTTISGGTIGIGGNFSVDSTGKVTASSVDLSGKISASSGSITGDLTLTGKLLGDTTIVEDDRIAVFNSTSGAEINRTGVSLKGAGSFGIDLVKNSFGAFEVKYGGNTGWEFYFSGAVAGQSGTRWGVSASSSTSVVGELAYKELYSGSQTLPDRGTWLVFRALGGDHMGIYSGGTNLGFNYQAIRIV